MRYIAHRIAAGDFDSYIWGLNVALLVTFFWITLS